MRAKTFNAEGGDYRRSAEEAKTGQQPPPCAPHVGVRARLQQLPPQSTHSHRRGEWDLDDQHVEPDCSGRLIRLHPAGSVSRSATAIRWRRRWPRWGCRSPSATRPISPESPPAPCCACKPWSTRRSPLSVWRAASAAPRIVIAPNSHNSCNSTRVRRCSGRSRGTNRELTQVGRVPEQIPPVVGGSVNPTTASNHPRRSELQGAGNVLLTLRDHPAILGWRWSARPPASARPLPLPAAGGRSW